VPPEIQVRWQQGIARIRAEQGEELDEAAAQAVLAVSSGKMRYANPHNGTPVPLCQYGLEQT